MSDSPAQVDTDHHGEDLPLLSKSSANLQIDKLLSTPMPSFDGKTPGSFFWSNFAYWISRRILAVQFRTSEVTGIDTLPLDRGNLCCAWHTNGLMDPLQIVLKHPNHFLMGGRHDLVTRPFLGWWTRKLAVQPVVRKAELLRGGCSEEEATQINGRSLLMLATGISAGFGCVLFPEGTSSDGNRVLPFKSAYFAVADHRNDGKPLSVQPVSIAYVGVNGLPIGRNGRPAERGGAPATARPGGAGRAAGAAAPRQQRRAAHDAGPAPPCG